MDNGLRACAGGADRFVVIDTETTGVFSNDRIVEIALITLSLDGEVIDVFDTLVQPGRDVSASHIHGITAGMVASAPTFADVAGDVAVRLDGACLVAHNLPFDFRMVEAEFRRLGAELTMTAGVCTLKATGCRLQVACSTFGIALDGAHRASVDATATAKLLSKVAERCLVGSPLAAPTGFLHSERVLRRDDMMPVSIPDPPLIVYLASRLSHTGVDVGLLAYLELVGRAVADMHLDAEERRQLDELARGLGLLPAHIAQAHRRFVNDLVDAAVADAVVTDAEYDMLVRIATALEVDQRSVEQRIRPYRATAGTIALATGMTIVFTGDHPRHDRDSLVQLATEIGLVVQSGVSKTTQVVAASDPESNSGKAGKARRYGIPIVSVDDFVNYRLGTIETIGGGQVALRVITCPDCHITWTVPATQQGQRSKRCADCAPLGTTPKPRQKTPVDMWAPPSIDWLTCATCGRQWSREVTRGRKPRECPTCIAS